MVALYSEKPFLLIYGDLKLWWLEDTSRPEVYIVFVSTSMFMLNRAESNVHWDYLPGIWCQTIGDWVDLFIVSNLHFRSLTKSPAANYRINLMPLIQHCMCPHYRCRLFSLFCDLSSNHVEHTMITMWSSHCEESPPKKEHSLFPWMSSLHGSTKHDLQRYDHIYSCWRSFSEAPPEAPPCQSRRPSFIEMGRLESQGLKARTPHRPCVPSSPLLTPKTSNRFV